MKYRIRPIRVEDLERDRTFLMSLSSTSRYNRMMCALREPSPSLLDRFVHVDYRNSMAFVAVLGFGPDERIIGVARYASERSHECEFAIAVADEWQFRGIGGTLLDLLFEYARTQGFLRIRGIILATNHRMLRLAHSLRMDVRQAPEDAALLEASRTL
jgi:acetyltransferase